MCNQLCAILDKLGEWVNQTTAASQQWLLPLVDRPYTPPVWGAWVTYAVLAFLVGVPAFRLVQRLALARSRS